MARYYRSQIPCATTHHIENQNLEPPFLCLVVSGGHSHLVLVNDYGKYEIRQKIVYENGELQAAAFFTVIR